MQLVSQSPMPLPYTATMPCYPHDPTAFPQGPVLEDGELYGGTGQWDSSSVGRVDLETGRTLRIHEPAEPQVRSVPDRIAT